MTKIKATRDATRVKNALAAIGEAARAGSARTLEVAVVRCGAADDQVCACTGQGNLMTLAVEAARARATVGEISDAMELVSRAVHGGRVSSGCGGRRCLAGTTRPTAW